MAYDAFVWSGIQAMNRLRTPQGTVWSCQVAGVTFGRFNRLAAAHAKSQDHRASCGVFVFGADRQGALANGLHGLNPRNTGTAPHPADCRPALIERLVKDRVQRWNQGPIYKRINPSGHLVLNTFLKKKEFKMEKWWTLSTLGEPMAERFMSLCITLGTT